MVNEGLNAMILYAPWFSKLLSIARGNVTVLGALQGMGQIHYTGASLNPEDEGWAVEQGIPVTVNQVLLYGLWCAAADINSNRRYMPPRKQLGASSPPSPKKASSLACA
jgi:hypothetical protein